MADKRSSNARTLFWIGFWLLLVGFGPLICGATAMAVVDAAGCTVNESYALPCPVAGIDISGLLGTMITATWFMFFTFLLIPVGGIAWLVAAISWLRHRGRPAD